MSENVGPNEHERVGDGVPGRLHVRTLPGRPSVRPHNRVQTLDSRCFDVRTFVLLHNNLILRTAVQQTIALLKNQNF